MDEKTDPIQGTSNGFGHAYKALFFTGAIQCIIGFLFVFSKKAMSVQTSILFLAVGGVLIGLGFWAMTSGRKTPVWIGICLCLCNLVFMLASGILGGFIATIILLFFLLRGVRFEPVPSGRKRHFDENAPLDSDL